MFGKYNYAGCNPDHKAIVYVLINFDTTIDQDLERIYTLRDMGYWAYVMIYDKEHADQEHRDLARWCNNRKIFASCPRFERYRITENLKPFVKLEQLELHFNDLQ